MPKHGGCFLCGAMNQENLKSRVVSGLENIHSVGLCDSCFALDDRTLRIKARQVQEETREAMRKLREARANG